MRAFFFGVFGSLSVEIVFLHFAYARGRRIPIRYTNWRFWILRTALALVGGTLAYAHKVQTDILAIQIGATAPAIFDAMTQKDSAKRDE